MGKTGREYFYATTDERIFVSVEFFGTGAPPVKPGPDFNLMVHGARVPSDLNEIAQNLIDLSYNNNIMMVGARSGQKSVVDYNNTIRSGT